MQEEGGEEGGEVGVIDVVFLLGGVGYCCCGVEGRCRVVDLWPGPGVLGEGEHGVGL